MVGRGGALLLLLLEEEEEEEEEEDGGMARRRASVGSPRRRVSHQRSCPSVEAETHWLPVLEETQCTS